MTRADARFANAAPPAAETLKPTTADQLRDAIAWACAESAALEIVGAGTKRGLGRPVAAKAALDVSGLSGIASYEPEELVLTAAAGTLLADVEAALAERRQQLAFEPPDFGPLFGGAPGRQTLGGVVAANLSGPRRIKAGAARDHFLGFHAVSGRGEAFKAGGKVVKNVTGYDLSKLMAGSYGTLVALSEITIKVLPAPETERTLVLGGLDDADGVAALTTALGGTHEVAGAAHLPGWAAASSSVPRVVELGGAATAIRVEGFAPSVAYRADALTAELSRFGAAIALEADESAALWREIRDAAPLVARPEALVWRASVAPTDGPKLAAAVRDAAQAEMFYDWGGGLVWLALDPGEDAKADVVRAAVAALGGHATLFRAPEPLRRETDVFQPQSPALAGLTARVKRGYDPRGILNPGRMYAGL